MKNSLFLSASLLALSTMIAGGTPIAAPRRTPTITVLYDQNSNFGQGIYSENFTSGSNGTAYNSAAADDFVVPAGKAWKITEVDVTGLYDCSRPPGVRALGRGNNPPDCGPATSEIITFYKNKEGLPAAAIGTPQTMNCTDKGGTFACILPSPVKLKGGTIGKTYWLSFVVNINFGTARAWYWTENTTMRGNGAVWENPGNGYGSGCPTWDTIENCLGSGPDLAFDLKGRSK